MKYYGIQNEVKAFVNQLQSNSGIHPSSIVLKTLNTNFENLKRTTSTKLGYSDVYSLYTGISGLK